MAKSAQLILDVTVPNSNLPTRRIDKRLTAGSLLLLDFSHPQSSAVVPSNGTAIKNLAYWESMQILSETVEANVSPTVVNTATTNGLKLEITTKKGLHGIVSQTNDIATGNDFQIVLPVSMRNYIFNNLSRGFFVSVWSRKTRLALTGSSANFMLFTANTNNNNVMAFGTGGGIITGANLGSRGSSTDLNSLANKQINGATSQQTGTASSTNFTGFKFGSGGPYSSFELNKACSEILYQIHIVDLTSAGLTYAQADALDLASWTAAFAIGGRFYQDTFTDPATFA